LLALRTSTRSFGVAEAERIARDLYGLAVSVSPLPGERDSNFRLRAAEASGIPEREYVLKIQDLGVDADGTDCLACVLDHLAEQAPTLPVPRLFPTQDGQAVGRFSRDGLDYSTSLVSFLPGRLMRDATANSSLLRGLGEMLARVDRALQGFFHPSLRRRLAWDVRRLPELAQFSGFLETAALREVVLEVCGEFRGALGRLRGLRSQAIHGDGHAGNLLVDPGRSICGILDFGDMIHAPLIFEPAVAMAEFSTEAADSPEWVGAVLQGFARVTPLQPEEVELLYDVICARLAATLLVHAWRREHDPDGARRLESARAGSSLQRLLEVGRRPLTQTWHEAAGTRPPAGARSAAAAEIGRRHRLMGAGAELFYERPLQLVRGAGVWLYDAAGCAYLDAYNNVPHVGHAHPKVVAAIQTQTATLATHTRYLHGSILDYAERLTARLPEHLDACIFVNSGSEANDVAWRMARMATGRQGALVMQHAYHGITAASAALTPRARAQDPRVRTIAVPPEGLRAGDEISPAALAESVLATDRAIAELEEQGAAPAAFFIDSSLTSSGIFDPPPAWAAAVSARVRAAGGLIVADEVQYGLGRSGSHFWGFERRGVEPDIVTLGKPVGNGYPMGVVVANRALIEAFQATCGFFSTFGGNPVAAAAGLAVLEVLDDEALMTNADRVGDYLRAQLQAVAARHACLGSVRGTGLLQGVEVLGGDASAAKLRNLKIVNILAAEFRILTGYEGPHAGVLKLRPPMPFGREHVDLLVEAIDAAAGAADRL
jgi:4-aminobutyrate aminotransferase-like enzyme/Ser/Thr protein kinase RdoA (MazF antagonist)